MCLYGRRMKSIVSAFMVTVILVGTLVMAFDIRPVEASGTIFIWADGSVDPPTAPISTVDNITYTFTDNINDSILVERSNIIVDGNGYTLLGSAGRTGFHILPGANNVTIRNTTVKNFEYGIFAYNSSFNTFSSNWFTANNFGIWLHSSSNYNSINGNNITNNSQGIHFYYSSSNSISGNNVTANSDHGISLEHSSSNNFSGNTMAHNLLGILLGYSSNLNNVSGNSITANNYNGIVVLAYSTNNTISGNSITANNEIGIWLDYSSSNNVSVNNITNNKYGIVLAYSSDNKLHHNHLIDNYIEQVGFQASGYANVWDDGYPFGGNYWSDYTGVDAKNGPNQDRPGSDGIGDTPYIITTDNTDRYPLMSTFWSSTMTGENVTVFPANDVCLIFESVTEEGLTLVEKPGTGPTPPPSVSILQYYVIVTTADYSGQITIKIVYGGSMGMLANTTQEGLRLLQCVMLAGDVDKDFDVDIFDLVRMAGVYGVKKPDPKYDSHSDCDLDGDGDIDIFDLVRMAGNYGKVWQPETGWADITTWFDPTTNSIFGVTQHLSIFGVTLG